MVDNLNHLLFTANVDTHIKVEIIIRLSFAPQTDEIKCVFQLPPKVKNYAMKFFYFVLTLAPM